MNNNNTTLKDHNSLNHQDHVSFVFDGRNGSDSSREHDLQRWELLLKRKFSLQQEGKKKWLENRELKYEKFFPVEFMNDKEFVLNHIQKYGYGLQLASHHLQDDREFVLKIIQLEPTEFRFASCTVRHDKEVVLTAGKKFPNDVFPSIWGCMSKPPVLHAFAPDIVQQNGLALQYAPKEFKRDRNIVLKAVRQNYEAVQWADDTLKSDKEIVMEAFKQNKKALHLVANQLLYAKNSLLFDQEFMLTVLKRLFPEFYHLKSFDYSKKHVMVKLVQEYGWLLKFASDPLKNDRNIVLNAVNNYGCSLQFASLDLKNDREVALAAVQQDGYALKYVSDELKRDKEIVLTAVLKDRCSLQFASEEMKNDRELVLTAVRQDGYALAFAPDTFKNDREIVLTAIRQNGDHLHLASQELRNDRQVVLEAVRSNGCALKYAGELMKCDQDIVLEAIQQKLVPLEYASQDLVRDPQFLLQVVKCGHEGVFRYLPKKTIHLTNEFLLQAIKINSLSIVAFCVPSYRLFPNLTGFEYIIEDKELMLEAVKNHGMALRYASKELQKDPELVQQALKCNGYVLEYNDELYQARIQQCYPDINLGNNAIKQ